jgi:hypothetical protein
MASLHQRMRAAVRQVLQRHHSLAKFHVRTSR